MATRSAKPAIATDDFDQRFDDGEDMGSHIDWSKARHVSRPERHLDLAFPAWMFESLQTEAERVGVGTDELIKMWLADRLDKYRRGQPETES